MNILDEFQSCLKEGEYVINKLSLLTQELSQFISIKFPDDKPVNILNELEGRN